MYIKKALILISSIFEHKKLFKIKSKKIFYEDE